MTHKTRKLIFVILRWVANPVRAAARFHGVVIDVLYLLFVVGVTVVEVYALLGRLFRA